MDLLSMGQQVRMGIEQQKLVEQTKHDHKIENNYLKEIDTSGLENLKEPLIYSSLRGTHEVTRQYLKVTDSIA
jgi:hypothetical protein